MALTQKQVSELYVAIFNRASEGEGNKFWQTSQTGAAAANAMLATADAKTYFGTSLNSNQAFIEHIYSNTLNKTYAQDKAGIDFWVNALNSGMSRGEVVASLVAAVADYSSSTDPVTKAAYDQFNNRVEVSNYMANTVEKAPADYATSTKFATSGTTGLVVTNNVSTVTTAKNSVQDLTIDGKTFTLTTGSDTFTGTAGNDTFNASVIMAANGTSLVDTLQGIDNLNGGVGTDTLKATINAGGSVTPVLTSIENVEVRSTATAGELNLSASTGVTAIKVANSTSDMTLTTIGAASVEVANQNQTVNINGSTATALNLTFDKVGTTVGTTITPINVDLGSATANAATSFAITANNAQVTMTETTGGAATTSATIAATGKNQLTFAAADAGTLTSVSVTGSGFVDLSVTNPLSAVTTLTAADGGLKATVTNATATAVTITTGAGVDTISAVGAGVKAINTGAGNDVVTIATSALAATATIDLGAGDDSLTLAAAPAAGATLTAGDGTDTLGMAKADYATVAGYTTTNLAKITGFEVLSITDTLATADAAYDVSKIAGITSFKAAAGITTAQGATVTNLGVNSTVELAGVAANNGTLTANLKTDTAADTMTLKLNKDYTDNNDTTINQLAASHAVVAAAVEKLNVVSTGNMATITPVAGYKADLVTNTLILTGSNALTDVVVSGNQALSFASTAAMTKLATIDGSSNTGGIIFDGNLAAITTPATSVAMTIKGSLTAANTLTGTGHADTIIGGSAADTIKGGLSGDTLTGNGGNDKFVYGLAAESTIAAGQTDTITDFIANTVGNATTGAVRATTDATKINGDVIDLKAFTALTSGIKVGVYANASDATTFISNANASDTAGGVDTFAYAALDSSTNKLYIDVTSDGTADMYINLTGVTTIDAAAFVMV